MSMQRIEETAMGRFSILPFDNAQSLRPVYVSVSDRRREETSLSKRPFLSLLHTWMLCAILLVLASTYGFSFERGSKNTTVGSAEQGIGATDSGESTVVKIQSYVIYLLSLSVMLPLVRTVGD